MRQLIAPGNLTASIQKPAWLLLSTAAIIMCFSALITRLDFAATFSAMAASSDGAIFTVLGMIGAVFANSTGAGGGVVFLPAFASLGFTESQAVSTSFGIQLFGMTAGALTWIYFYRSGTATKDEWKPFLPLVLVCSPLSATGLWLVYALDLSPPADVIPMFAGFSLFLGISILATAILSNTSRSRRSIETVDFIAVTAIALGGGVVTAWLSVGVGEFLAFYLILRRYNATLSVATAVVVSAITVWCAAPVHLGFGDQAAWKVIAFAGPGAIIGGVVAKQLVMKLGAVRLKFLFGVWLLVIGLSEFVAFG